MNKTAYLESIVSICKRQLEDINIPIADDVSFSINTRAKKRFGRTSKQGDKYSIEIASELINPQYVIGLKNTVMHELIHTAHGCMNHGVIWRSYANTVKNCLGVEITCGSTRASKGLPPQTYKYNFVCTECGAVFGYHRKPKWYNEIHTVNCSCGGDIKEKA